MKRILIVASLVLLASPGTTLQAVRTREAVVAGMSCKQNSGGSLECDYRVGRSLHVNIAGVGDEDASITFLASSFDGDYYASVGLLHGCVIVKPGRVRNPIDFAFISPLTRKVYGDWGTCGDAR